MRQIRLNGKRPPDALHDDAHIHGATADTALILTERHSQPAQFSKAEPEVFAVFEALLAALEAVMIAH